MYGTKLVLIIVLIGAVALWAPSKVSRTNLVEATKPISGQQTSSITTSSLSGRLSSKLNNLFSNIKRASFQGVDYAREVASSIPFTKILMAGGALLSLLFIFVRLLIVLGPIILLGALTRESTDATDLIRMLIEFYNQVVLALDEQMSAQPAQQQR